MGFKVQGLSFEDLELKNPETAQKIIDPDIGV